LTGGSNPVPLTPGLTARAISPSGGGQGIPALAKDARPPPTHPAQPSLGIPRPRGWRDKVGQPPPAQSGQGGRLAIVRALLTGGPDFGEDHFILGSLRLMTTCARRRSIR
jgi:hypothetical protein